MTGTRRIYRPDRMEQGFYRGSLLAVIRKLGLTPSLQVCLDAGDAASAPASPTSWLDLSGNAFDFFLGTTGGADATDPTFNGTTGRLSNGEYFSVDGGDQFRYDTANETWMNAMHQDSALFTLVAWVMFPNVTAAQTISGTSGNNQTGIRFFINTTPALRVNVRNATAVVYDAGTLTPSASVWLFCGMAIDEAGATGSFIINNAVEALTPTYSSPAAGASTQTMEICASGGGSTRMASGGRVAQFAAWSGKALSAGELQALFALTRGKFGV